jgi:hypothetical protein
MPWRRGDCEATSALGHRHSFFDHLFIPALPRDGVMKTINVHERTIATPLPIIGALLDTLASDDDKFWPHKPGQFF